MVFEKKKQNGSFKDNLNGLCSMDVVVLYDWLKGRNWKQECVKYKRPWLLAKVYEMEHFELLLRQ